MVIKTLSLAAISTLSGHNNHTSAHYSPGVRTNTQNLKHKPHMTPVLRLFTLSVCFAQAQADSAHYLGHLAMLGCSRAHRCAGCEVNVDMAPGDTVGELKMALYHLVGLQPAEQASCQ